MNNSVFNSPKYQIIYLTGVSKEAFSSKPESPPYSLKMFFDATREIGHFAVVAVVVVNIDALLYFDQESCNEAYCKVS